MHINMTTIVTLQLEVIFLNEVSKMKICQLTNILTNLTFNFEIVILISF